MERMGMREITYAMNLFREKGNKLRGLHQAGKEDFDHLAQFMDLLDLGEGFDRQRMLSEGSAVLVNAYGLHRKSEVRAEKRRQKLEKHIAIPAGEVGLWAEMPQVREVEEVFG